MLFLVYTIHVNLFRLFKSKTAKGAGLFSLLFVLSVLSTQNAVASIYNNFSNTTIEISGNPVTCHFSPDTIFVHSKDTIYWKNTCGNSVTILSDSKTLRGNLDVGTLQSGEVSSPYTDFAEGTTAVYIKTHGRTFYGIIIVLPTPASANHWQIFSRENIITNESSMAMGDDPLETDLLSDLKPALQFGGSIQISSQIRHQN